MRKPKHFSVFCILVCLFLLQTAVSFSQEMVSQFTYLDLSARLQEAQSYLNNNVPVSIEEKEWINSLIEPVLQTGYLDLRAKARILLAFADENRWEEGSFEDTPGEIPALLLEEIGAVPREEALLSARRSFTMGMVSFGIMGASLITGAVLDEFLPETSLLPEITSALGLAFAVPGFLGLTVSLPGFSRHLLAEETPRPVGGEESPGQELKNILRSYEEKMFAFNSVLEGGPRHSRDLVVTRLLGVSSILGGGLALYNADTAYQRYRIAKYTEDAVSLRREVGIYSAAGIASGIMGIVWFTTALAVDGWQRDSLQLHRDLSLIESELTLRDAVEPDEILLRQLERLERKREILLKELIRGAEYRKKNTSKALILFGSGLAGAAGMVTFRLLGDNAFQDYNASMLERDAEKHRNTLALHNTLKSIFGVGAWSLFGGGTLLVLGQPDLEEIKAELRNVDREITFLRAQQNN